VWLTPPNEPEQRFGTNTGVYFTIRENNDSFESFGTGRLNEAFTVTLPDDSAAHWIQSQLFSTDMLSTVGASARGLAAEGSQRHRDQPWFLAAAVRRIAERVGSHRGSRCRHRSDRGGYAREFSAGAVAAHQECGVTV
jgi:hypothetical protein